MVSLLGGDTFIVETDWSSLVIFEQELSVAMKAAKAAGLYLQEHQKQIEKLIVKTNSKDFATQHDMESDRIILSTIREIFPDDYILSEEGNTDPSRGRCWIVDPLDGTRNYASGLPNFCVSIALVVDGITQVGVVYAPALNNELFTAVRSLGATLNGESYTILHPQHTLVDSLIATGFSYFKGQELEAAMQPYTRMLNATTDVLRFGAAALDLCTLSTGRIGGYYERGLKPWDIAAGILIAEEQGCVITNYFGDEVDMYQKTGDRYDVHVVCGKNKTIHDEMLLVLK